MSDKTKGDIKCIGILLLIAIPFGAMIWLQGGGQIEDVEVFTVAQFSSTDNENIQLVVKGTKILSGPYENYFSLPYKMSFFGHTLIETVWFTERYKINETWTTVEHGPFEIYFESGYPGYTYFRTIELDYNNVTVTEL